MVFYVFFALLDKKKLRKPYVFLFFLHFLHFLHFSHPPLSGWVASQVASQPASQRQQTASQLQLGEGAKNAKNAKNAKKTKKHKVFLVF